MPVLEVSLEVYAGGRLDVCAGWRAVRGVGGAVRGQRRDLLSPGPVIDENNPHDHPQSHGLVLPWNPAIGAMASASLAPFARFRNTFPSAADALEKKFASAPKDRS